MTSNFFSSKYDFLRISYDITCADVKTFWWEEFFDFQLRKIIKIKYRMFIFPLVIFSAWIHHISTHDFCSHRHTEYLHWNNFLCEKAQLCARIFRTKNRSTHKGLHDGKNFKVVPSRGSLELQRIDTPDRGLYRFFLPLILVYFYYDYYAHLPWIDICC